MDEIKAVETERLHLRQFTLADLEGLYRLLSNPDVVRYVGNGRPASREESETALVSILKHWERHGFGRWCIADRKSGRMIGYGGLRSLVGTPELVYHFEKPAWGKGLATEMARAVLRYGFKIHDFDRIVAIAKPANAASVRVMQKVGMRFEKYATYFGIYVVQYQLLKSEWHQSLT